MNYIEYARVLNARDEVNTWVSHNLKNHLEKNPENQDEIEHIIDYLASEDAPERLIRMSYMEAKANAEKWTITQQKKGLHIKESPEDTEIALDFKDGFKVVRLKGKNAYKREGYLMRHCVSSYYGKETEIYCLRDKDNMPHCTIEKDRQVKGKGNGDIHPAYIGYVVAFLKSAGISVGDNEMKHLGYINVERFKKDLSDKTEYFDKKYVPENARLISKDGNEFASFDLWDVKPLIKDDASQTLKINFLRPASINFKKIIMTPIDEIVKEFEKTIGHDDFCKTIQYPNSSWDCNCYMKDSLKIIRTALEKVEKETSKAFGGCKNCYGKGYATTIEFATGSPDFEGDPAPGTTKLPEMRFCSCERGKELKRRYEQYGKQEYERGKKENLTTKGDGE